MLDVVRNGLLPVISGLDAAAHIPHALHDQTRHWPETNCYVDLWIEILGAQGLNPQAGLGFTLTQDFEGDHFTFFKFPLEDLETLYGVRVQELSIYDRLDTHVLEQMARGRLVLVEVDGHYLPDTRGLTYRMDHSKTTIGINVLDVDRKRMEYFHNAGYFTLEGEDFDGVFQNLPTLRGRPEILFPYAEFVKFGALHDADAETAMRLLRKHYAQRPLHNPVSAFRARIGEQARMVSERDPAFFHKYAFNTMRQLGANFELLGSHLDWLSANGQGAFDDAAAHCEQLAAGAKTCQFQLARVVNRKRFDALESMLEPLEAAYDSLFAALAPRLG